MKNLRKSAFTLAVLMLLASGGFLVLGKVESLLGDARSLFTPVNARERVFQKA